MEQAKKSDRDEEEKGVDPIEEGEIEDKKRNFINKLRPHERVWNFIEDDEETKVPHVLRYNADPTAAYRDGRVQDLLTVIEGMGAHLFQFSRDDWRHLNN